MHPRTCVHKQIRSVEAVIQSYCKIELENFVTNFEIENFINTNSFFENYYKNDHSYPKKNNEACLGGDRVLTAERTECVKIDLQSPYSSAVAMPAADEVSTKKVSKSGGITCCVQQCSNNSKKRKNLSFYAIPKDEKLKQLWLNKLSRKNFKPTNIFKLKRKRT